MTRKSPAFSFYPDSWVLGTMSMSFEDQGIYFRMLCFQWSNGPSNTNEYTNVCGLVYKSNVERILSSKFTCKDGLYFNARLEAERLKQEDRSTKAKASIEKRWKNEKQGKSSKADTNVIPDGIPNGYERIYERNTKPILESIHSDSVSVSVSVSDSDSDSVSKNNTRLKAESPKKTKSNSLSVERPYDVDQQTWNDWMTVRKSKRAGPVTVTVMKLLKSEADKAGLSVQEAIETAAGSGWQTFKESYATERKSTQKTFAELSIENSKQAIQEFCNG